MVVVGLVERLGVSLCSVGDIISVVGVGVIFS